MLRDLEVAEHLALAGESEAAVDVVRSAFAVRRLAYRSGADLVHAPEHLLHPTWEGAFDHEPDVALSGGDLAVSFSNTDGDLRIEGRAPTAANTQLSVDSLTGSILNAVCDKYDLPYTTGSFLMQYGKTWRTIAKLSLPNKMTSDA